MSLFKFLDPTYRYLASWQKRVAKINELESSLGQLNDQELRAKTQEFKNRMRDGEPLDSLLEEAFAAVRESAKRTLKQRHFDVQLLGGMCLHNGMIAEMHTGEGKTLAATAAVYLNALEEKGVHVVTVNDYLAKRDTVWMGQIYDFLGLSVGCLTHESGHLYDPSVTGGELERMRDERGGFLVVEEFLRPCSRKEAYRADITYGTNHEFGFDYLRDNLILDKNQIVQRLPEEGGFHFAIVDEVDSILIDEARTPLIISAPEEESSKLYQKYQGVVTQLKKDIDFQVDEKRKTATLTEEGIVKLEKILGMDIFSLGLIREIHHLQESLRANFVFQRDKDYVVKDGEVIIVDPFTGRLMHGRRWSGGLHQAIEAKERVKIQEESRTVATITFQNYFRMYKKLAGMTGTAITSAEEFHKVYALEVISIPTNKPMIRTDHPDEVYLTEEAKYRAIVQKAKECQEKGQPVLVGSVSVEKNELISAHFKKAGISHEILNAKNHEREGQIIAQAGKLSKITVATNMAGRGVDIILGGNPQDSAEAEKIKEVGGLLVLGTERHESRRIDNQLRGRGGRQGDPGESQFFISLEDDLARIFGSEKLKNFALSLGFPEDQPLQHSFITKAIEQAQQKVEGFNFDARKHLLDYDDVLNRQRNFIYGLRQKLLFEQIDMEEFLKERIHAIIEFIFSQPVTENTPEMVRVFFNLKQVPKDLTQESLKKEAFELLEEKKKILGPDAASSAEGQDRFLQTVRFLALRLIDALWQEHLEFLDYFREAVMLRAYGQRDPLVEYRGEAHKAFKEMQKRFDEALVNMVFKIERADIKLPQQATAQASGSRQFGKIGRNDPCPCGAKKPDGTPIKYKRCHGA